MARPRKEDEINAIATLSVRLTYRLRLELDVTAARNGRSITDEVRAALEAHVMRSHLDTQPAAVSKFRAAVAGQHMMRREVR